MLKNNPNNKNAIRVKRILDGEIGCSTYNLRMCYFNESKQEHDKIEACLREVREKMSPEQIEEFSECIAEFEEKLQIYDRFFRELSRREKEGIK